MLRGLVFLLDDMKVFSWILLLCSTAVAPIDQGPDIGPTLARIASATEAQLDSMYGPLVYLMRTDERGIYPGLTVVGKREFLRRFWADRDPTPGTPRNEAAEAFNGRIAVVNKKFAVPGTNPIAGWRTDRGRIYLEYGQPDIVMTRRGPGIVMPFEIWKYMHPKPRKYCFVDLTRFGNYVLVFSSDPREPSRPNWEQLIGDEAYEDALRF